MSQTYYLICRKCRKELWIGQGPYRRPEGFSLYTNDQNMSDLREFLIAHFGHDLAFVDLDMIPEDWPDDELDDLP